MLYKAEIKQQLIDKLHTFSKSKGKYILNGKRLLSGYINKFNLHDLILTINDLTAFLPSNRKMSERIFCILNDVYETPKCHICGNFTNLKYNSENKCFNYLNFCSIKCVNLSPITREKIINTNLKKYGCKYSTQNPNVRAKAEKTNLERYGGKNPMHSDTIKDKHKQVIFEKFGVDNVSKLAEIKEKKKQKSLEVFGTECVFQSDVVKQKTKQTNLKRYGVENANQSKEISSQGSLVRKNKYFNGLLENKIFTENVKFKFNFDDYVKNTNHKKRFKFECLKCGSEFIYRLLSTILPICPRCNPPITKSSAGERELYEFVKTFCSDAVPNQTRILGGRNEIDIYSPSKKIGIEFNGLYWHGEFSKGRNSKYHLNKTLLGLTHGITLIHIFEDEYKSNKTIVNRIVRRKMGVYDNNINVNDCIFSDINKLTFENFIKDNSLLLVTDKFKRYVGIYHNKTLIGCYSTNDDIFICNLTVLPEYYINGLTNSFLDKSLVVDMRFGCDYIPPTHIITSKIKPTTFYIQNSKRLLKKDISFKHYDKKLPMVVNLQLNRIDRIYDCGKFVYSPQT